MDSSREIQINGKTFRPLPGVVYRHDYQWAVEQILSDKVPEWDMYRTLVLDDLWFIVYFVIGWEGANHPFIVQACNEVQDGPDTETVDIWGREHGKSTIITIGENIQDIMRNPEITISIFSFKREIAKAFLLLIKEIFEKSDFLKWLFPDILYDDPAKQAPKWGEESGLIVKRSKSVRECTVEAHGLIDGMPTSKHFDKRIYDDVTTPELSESPENMRKVERRFWMSENLGKDGGRRRVIGTIFHYADLASTLMTKKKPDGSPAFHVRKKPSLEGGREDGASVFLSQERISTLRMDVESFNTQHLLDPNPLGQRKLSFDKIRLVQPREIPPKLHNFMLVDPSGEAKVSSKPNPWAIFVVGVQPYVDDLGLSNVYIVDGLIKVMSEDEAIAAIVAMYLRTPRIYRVGVEKVGMATFDTHIRKALRAKRRFISHEDNSLMQLYPGQDSKQKRIADALVFPMNQGKWHMSVDVPQETREQLRDHMDNFPTWEHEDGPDALSYLYRLIEDFDWAAHPVAKPKEEEDRFERAERRAELKPRSWQEC